MKRLYILPLLLLPLPILAALSSPTLSHEPGMIENPSQQRMQNQMLQQQQQLKSRLEAGQAQQAQQIQRTLQQQQKRARQRINQDAP